MQGKARKAVLLIAALELLLVAASRLLVLHQIRMGGDEIWSVWQTLGTPQQIMDWTPYDWTPGYYLTLGVWRGFVGMLPFALRMLSLLAFLIGCAALYRVAWRLGGERAALVVIPAYGALGYAGVLGTEVRGYALLLGLLPLALWFLLRFYTRPSWKRAIPLILSLTAMPYISLSAFVTLAMVGLFSLMIYGQRAWKAWLPALITIGLVLPIVADKLTLARSRVSATETLVLPAPLLAFGNLFQDYLGRFWIVWAVILVIGIPALLPRARSNRIIVAIAVWVAGGVILMYLLNPVLGFYVARYSWWVMIGIALLVALGLAYLPKQAIVVAAFILIGLSFVATPLNEQSSALNENMEWLRDHMQPGDALVIDPVNKCGGAYEWDYALRAYFPNGVLVANNPAGYRRVWFATFDGQQPSTLYDQITTRRVPDRYVGPASCFIRLYEGPPYADGILFENGMRFHGADIIDSDGHLWSAPVVRHEGQTVKLRLWWSADKPVDLDYSVGTYILGSSLIAQADGAPQLVFPADAPRETSRWKTNQLYVEERTLKLPDQLSIGEYNYNLDLAVYDSQTNFRVTAQGEDADHLLFIQQIIIKAW